MTPFEYILPLIAVLVGLAIADFAVSLHRLLRARKRVEWDWLALAGAVLAILALLEVWWTFYSSRDAAFYTSLGGFLPLLGQVLILFLLAASALPDDVPGDASVDAPLGAQNERFSLRSFYEQNSPYYWTLFATYVAFIVSMRVVNVVIAFDEVNLVRTAVSLIPNLAMLGIMIALVRNRSRMLHALVMIAFLALFLAQWWGLRLVS